MKEISVLETCFVPGRVGGARRRSTTVDPCDPDKQDGPSAVPRPVRPDGNPAQGDGAPPLAERGSPGVL